jgi:D-sedoheptulose 7-phosphate isomerase
MSGFTFDNPLRVLGDINFYIDSDRYAFVEIGHLTLCHAIPDFLCGLRVPDEGLSATTRLAPSNLRV